jgi:hypothetical protein
MLEQNFKMFVSMGTKKTAGIKLQDVCQGNKKQRIKISIYL